MCRINKTYGGKIKVIYQKKHKSQILLLRFGFKLKLSVMLGLIFFKGGGVIVVIHTSTSSTKGFFSEKISIHAS